MENFKVGDKVRLNIKYYFEKDSNPRLLGLKLTDINELVQYEGMVKEADYDDTCNVYFKELNIGYHFLNNGIFKV